jgi:hypothetical protein
MRVYGYEAMSMNIIWQKCSNPNCRYRDIEIKSDPQGFVLEPVKLRGKYLYSLR